MAEKLRKIADNTKFQNFITIIIIIAGILVGLDTYPYMTDNYGGIIHFLDKIVLYIFAAEVLIKLGAEGSKPWRYFLDPWNVFDFIIVVAAFMPFGGSSVAVLRLVRLLRVLRLVTAVPKLQLLVSALIRSIPSMGYVSILLFLLFYVYGVAAVIFFAENDPQHFPDLQTAMVSLFRAVTLEDWTDLMYIQMYGCDKYGFSFTELCKKPQAMPVGGAVFFISFVLLGTMIILNLFIGVIMTGMDEAKMEFAELEAEKKGTQVADIHLTVEQLRGKLHEINDLVVAIDEHNRRGKP